MLLNVICGYRSQDDPLLLYAALKGGEKTFFISRDLMRSHLFALEDAPIKLLFQKWLVSHQYMLGFFTKQGRPSILVRLSFSGGFREEPRAAEFHGILFLFYAF